MTLGWGKENPPAPPAPLSAGGPDQRGGGPVGMGVLEGGGAVA